VPTPSHTHIENRHRIQPDDTNNYDTAHGGTVMRLMDEVGAMSAMRLAGETCVTARVEALNFERPIPRGDIAVVESWAYDTGRTSVKIRLVVDREDPRTGESERTSESTFVFVAVDESGTPVAVPELQIETECDERLRERGLADDP
jgi:acyl-CoA hydrolase